MTEEQKPQSRPWSIPAAVVSVVVAGLLGLSAGAKVDEFVRPTLGPDGAMAAGFGTALAVLVLVGVLSYRGLTR